ncbi:polyprenyl synthetase family protein [bacterium]|nr:polyprenyl synthetase family protein [bacterium]
MPHSSASSDVLAEISRYLDDDVARVRGLLRELVNTDSQLIRDVADYLNLTSGKMLRPKLLLLVARAFGGSGRAAPIEIAAAMEAIHVATLLHDDVIDKGDTRRGQPSVNARWGTDVAVLMADFLFAASFELAMTKLDPKPLQLICQVTRRMCEGEIFQIERRGQWATFEDYFYVITCKTARLFSACAALGANHAGLNEDMATQVAAFGLDFGLAFQITDDTLDYTARDGQLGKPAGLDLASGKQTLPLILAMRDASPEDLHRLRELLGNGKDPVAIREILDRYDSIAQSIEQAGQYARSASGHLEGLPIRDPEAYAHLQSLARYVVARKS